MNSRHDIMPVVASSRLARGMRERRKRRLVNVAAKRCSKGRKLMKTLGYAAQSAASPLAPFPFERRSLRGNDVAMDVLYCGVCHSDLHMARNDWGWSFYPLVPGHEIVGRVTEVGAEVKTYKVGDHVAVGCMVDSCQNCDQCKKGLEQYCREGNTQTYGGRDRITCEPTYGGYSKTLIVREEFALRVPEVARSLPRRAAALRRNHDLFAAQGLERRSGQPRRRGRPRRPWAHGGQARQRARRRRHGAQPHQRQAKPTR